MHLKLQTADEVGLGSPGSPSITIDDNNSFASDSDATLVSPTVKKCLMSAVERRDLQLVLPPLAGK